MAIEVAKLRAVFEADTASLKTGLDTAAEGVNGVGTSIDKLRDDMYARLDKISESLDKVGTSASKLDDNKISKLQLAEAALTGMANGFASWQGLGSDMSQFGNWLEKIGKGSDLEGTGKGIKELGEAMGALGGPLERVSNLLANGAALMQALPMLPGFFAAISAPALAAAAAITAVGAALWYLNDVQSKTTAVGNAVGGAGQDSGPWAVNKQLENQSMTSLIKSGAVTPEQMMEQVRKGIDPLTGISIAQKTSNYSGVAGDPTYVFKEMAALEGQIRAAAQEAGVVMGQGVVNGAAQAVIPPSPALDALVLAGLQAGVDLRALAAEGFTASETLQAMAALGIPESTTLAELSAKGLIPAAQLQQMAAQGIPESTTLRDALSRGLMPAPNLLALISGGLQVFIAGLTGGGGSGTPPPKRATGGQVVASRGYLVGENGPELFTPGTGGNIVPMRGGAGGSGGIQVGVVNVYGVQDVAAFYDALQREAARRNR